LEYAQNKESMKLKHPFSEETRLRFIFCTNCFRCGKGTNSRDAHHVLGRISSSPLNLAVLCTDCHIENHTQKPFTEEEKSHLLKTTIRFLVKEKYQFNEKDIDFYEKHKKYYE